MPTLRQIVDGKVIVASGTSEGAIKGWDERGRNHAKEKLSEHGWKPKQLKYTGTANEHGTFYSRDQFRKGQKIELGRNGWSHSRTEFGIGKDIARGSNVESLSDHLEKLK